MFDILLWLISIEAFGLAAFPLAYYLFPNLSDRGFSVSKPLGILLICYFSWILSVLRLVPSNGTTIALLFLSLATLSAVFFWKHRKGFQRLWEFERNSLIISEVVYLVVVVFWLIYRSHDPAINHTEQPMDFMYLNASIQTDIGTPEDPWLRGEPISYYYFGYWMYGAIAKFTGIASQISFNLALAVIPAMSAVGAFGLVYNMVRAESRRFRRAIGAGILAAVLLTSIANLEGVLEFGHANGIGSASFYEWVGIDGLEKPESEMTQSWRPNEFWWWWRASRVIGMKDAEHTLDYTITEFPFFSFMLGDMHPHVMSIPLVLLFLAACYNYLRSQMINWRRVSIRTITEVGFLGLALGGLGFTNMWDFPVFAAIFISVAALRSYAEHGPLLRSIGYEILPVLFLVLGVALFSISPYLMNFSSQVSGIGPVIMASSRPFHILIFWGLFLCVIVPFILSEFCRTKVDNDWATLLWISMVVGFGPFAGWVFLQAGRGGTVGEMATKLFHVMPFALIISIAVYTLLWLTKKSTSSSGKIFALGLSISGLLLIMGPDLFYVDDSFGGASERMNTVFKLYYQAWIILAIASGFIMYYWVNYRESLTGTSRLLTTAWGIAFVFLLMGSSYYPPAAAASKSNLFGNNRTLDGLTHLGPTGSEYQAIMFLKKEADSNSAVLEAVGRDYSQFGRISGSTGIPTVLGWPGHEIQWRGSNELFDDRELMVQRIYQTLNVAEAKNLLNMYAVDYVYVGAREREAYGTEGLGKFPGFMDRVFTADGVDIYKTRD
ncbi:MAG: DUF2298 domain-containing protein [SAR202 cluster bacterium]|jgi:YYY domain-containing protein|nr:DUF2298 domain-containing protein [SAR202 cluster bacterium]